MRKIRQQKGATLVELAITLGVIGLVGAAIWATADAVRARQPVQDSVQLVTEIASNVRNVYTGFPNATPETDLVDQIDLGFFPDSTVNADRDDTVNAWGGTIRLTFPNANPLHGFSIEFSLPNSMAETDQRDACLGMITRMQGSATTDSGGSAYATSGTLPDTVPPLEPTQGMGPALVFVNTGGAWINVTGVAPLNLFGANASGDCAGFAYYYRL